MSDDSLKIPVTIERHLEKYSKKEGHTDRHETLWHAWCQNKRWLAQLMQITIYTFPTYSRHDETHALSVLNNIEMLLGEERISELSATDCFVLLHTVYIHDIGMCITQQDRKEIIENQLFADMLEELEEEGDEAIRKAVKILKCTDYNFLEKDNVLDLKRVYRAKLDVYYAVIELLANYRRKEHGEKSAQRLYKWTMEPDKLGIGFSMAGIPLRIFLAIARSAQMHTCGNFDEIRTLPRKDGGYASDYYHPRFISVLLMLGDLLDMDNDRFHPLVFEFVEDFPITSKNHFDKHRAVRKLHISPKVIEIEADCENQNALRLLRKECDMLADILRNAGYMWASMCPEKFKGSLPTLGEVDLFLKGKQIPEELVTAQFSISQKKAFSILEGSNLYGNRFIFLREFLQNAVDSSKIQYWHDYMGTASYYYGKENIVHLAPNEMNEKLSIDNYPIEISMCIQKKDKDGLLIDIEDEDAFLEQLNGKFEYGVTVSVKDFGTGIDKDSIIAISKVGNSRLRDKEIIKQMPEWLRPTAEFGVGLQSAFLVNGSFKCYTHTRSGQVYEITFSTGASSRYEGYINVIPVKNFSGRDMTYGARFEIFIPIGKKFLHSEKFSTWDGRDPFSENYEQERPMRHAIELISQMILYLDGILGEPLFPIILKVPDNIKLSINTNIDNRIKKAIYVSDNRSKMNFKKSWIFDIYKEHEAYIFGETEDTIYALQINTARLYIWNKRINTFCAISGKKLREKEENQTRIKKFDTKKSGTTVYYKGVELQHRCFEEEIEMFEYIDIKGDLKRSYINISRRGFTPEGEKYFERNIYERLVATIKECLIDINKHHREVKRLLCQNIEKKLEEIPFELTDKMKDNRGDYSIGIRDFIEQLLSLALLAHLVQKDVLDELTKLGGGCGKEERCIWQEVIQGIKKLLKEEKYHHAIEELKRYAVLFRIQSYKYKKFNKNSANRIEVDSISILDIFDEKQHYGILQKRESRNGRWISYIISIDSEYYNLFKLRTETFNTDVVKRTDREINIYFETMLYLSKNIGISVADNLKYEQQYFLNWLAKNIPILAAFCDETGNVRLNVLSNVIYPCVYLNKNHKILILDRILEYADARDIQRFSTFAWQNWQYLAIKNLPFSCFFVKRGYMNKISLHKIIFPLDGNLMKKIYNVLKEVSSTSIIENVRLLVEMLDVKHYCNSLVEKYNTNKEQMTHMEYQAAEKLFDISRNMERTITSTILEFNVFFNDIMPHIGDDGTINMSVIGNSYFEELKIRRDEWNRFVIKCIYEFEKTETNSYFDIEEVLSVDIAKFVFQGYYFLRNNFNEVVEDNLKIRRIKAEYIKRKEDYVEEIKEQRILRYIDENSYYPIRKERIEKCYQALIEEIFSLLEEIEKNKLEEILMDMF